MLFRSAGAHTFNIGTVLGAPGQVGFQMNSVLTGTGAITKTGGGILGLATISPAFAGTTTVNQGSVQFTQNAATASFTLANPVLLTGAFVLDPAGTLNAGGFVGSVGPLSGTGTVTNSINGILANTSQIINKIGRAHV